MIFQLDLRNMNHFKTISNPLDDDSLTSEYYETDAKQIPYKTAINAESEDCLVFQQLDMFSEGFHIMEEIRKHGILCDVTLIADSQSFNGHRIVLAATIPYFRAMFSHDMVESKQKEIVIKGIDATALESLINFAYTGRVAININNVQSLMFGASFLQLPRVKNACADFLKNRFNPNIVLGIRNFADTLGCSQLVNAADKYIQQNFRDVSLSEEFLSVMGSELIKIVKNDELDVSSEEEVYEAVIRWVKKDPEVRKSLLPQLLACVRLPLLKPQYLVDRVSKNQLIKSSHECRDLLDEARDFHLIPERRPLLPTFKSQPRCCSYLVGYIFAVGGLTKSGDSLSTVETYDPICGNWKMAEAMSMLRSRVGVAVMNNKLFAVGGYNGSERLSTAEVFNPIERVWSRVSPMHYNRSAVGAAALNGRLYVCGGYDGISSLSTVECYIPEKDEWNIIESMQKHRSAGGVIAFNEHIYALGGHDGLSIFDSVERFNPRTCTWTSVTPMQTKRCRLGVAVLNGKLYVCGGYDGATFLQSVEVYDPVNDKWEYVAPMNVMRSRVALVSNMNKLWAIGGYDGISNLASVEVYDPQTNSWSFVAPMCAHEGGVGAGVIPLR